MPARTEFEGLEVPEKDRAMLWHYFPGYMAPDAPEASVGSVALCGARKR